MKLTPRQIIKRNKLFDRLEELRLEGEKISDQAFDARWSEKNLEKYERLEKLREVNHSEYMITLEEIIKLMGGEQKQDKGIRVTDDAIIIL